MKRFGAIFAIPLLAMAEYTDAEAAEPIAKVVRSDLGTVAVHGTTRGHQRKVVYLKGVWIVAYSNEQGSHLRLSRDGVDWAKPVTFHQFKSSSSYTLVVWRQRLFLFYTDFQPDSEQRKYQGVGVAVRAVFVRDGTLALDGKPWPVMIDPKGNDFYISAAVGPDGTFWVQSRHPDREREVTVTRLTRSTVAGGLDEWTKPVRPVAVENKGSIVPLIVPLPDGKAYAFARTYQALWGRLDPDPKANRLLGSLFDGERWSEQASVIAPRMTHVMGDDRRMSAVFDAKSNVLHLVYVDAGSVLRHRQLHPPYREEHWRPMLKQPGTEVYRAPVHCAVASLDPHVTPSQLYVVLGRELKVGRDPRHRTGELRSVVFEGSTWQVQEEPLSEPDSNDNWYPNVAAEVNSAGELGILYMQGPGKGPYRVRFAVPRVRPRRERR